MTVRVYLGNSCNTDMPNCQIVVIDNKSIKEDTKKMYAQKLVTAIQEQKGGFIFYVDEIPKDKKIAKLTSEAITECLFDVGWYCSKNILDDRTFDVIISVSDPEAEKHYKKALKKMGF
ncbi:MAG: hypothetical protein KH452_13740 [Clostridiales bacterium]|nr:hypothetical protein [Clostridiales bacterium]